MDKEEFNSLKTERQVEEFNELIKIHGSITKASKIIDIDRKTLKIRFRKDGYEFDHEAKKFIKGINTKVNKETSSLKPVNSNEQDTNSNIIETPDKSSSKITETESKENNNLVDISQLDNIIDVKLEKLLDKYLKNNSDPKKNDNSVIKISSECNGNVKYSTYGIYEGVVKKFNEYLKKHDRFTKIEIVSQALIEYMENHK